MEGLKGASRGLFLAELFKKVKRNVLVLTGDQHSAEQLFGDLRFFTRKQKNRNSLHFFPSWELLPYEELSPLKEISGERLDILHRLVSDETLFLIAPVEAVFPFVLPRNVLKTFSFSIQKGDVLEREVIEACLADGGYCRSSLVEERGQFSLRGDILDLFIPSYENPIRIEFFGDEVESLRKFDIGSQVSFEEIEFLHVLPVREVCLNQKILERGIEKIKSFGQKNSVDGLTIQEIEEKLRNLGDFSGIESLAPFLYEERQSLLDYLLEDTIVVLDEAEQINKPVEKLLEMVSAEYTYALDRKALAAHPEDLYLNANQFQSHLNSKTTLALNTLKLSTDSQENAARFDIRPIPTIQGKFDEFAEHACKWLGEGNEITIVAPTKGHVSRVHEFLEQYGLELDVDQGKISSGYLWPESQTILVAEHEIFGRSHKHRYRRKPKTQSFQRTFKDLKRGDFLVHIDYGIGKYNGVRELEMGIEKSEFLEIFYAGDEKLYIPMDGLGYLQKYVGTGDAPPPMDKLGGIAWKRQKNKVKEAVREMAEELLKLYAKRELSQGKSYDSNPVMIQEFADSFEFVETDDQMKAIDEVYEDLEKPKPMDRLICGDVGFGKTEVAMRAAFKVVLEKKQVAVLAPTTILAQQHLNTFRERFREYPINIEMISRFRSHKEQKVILEQLKKGQVDILIGTHKILGKSVQFAELGLIIIDEEQRFGVKHKERLKELRTTVDILTLTATPIPRTLHFSLMGVRDLSVIETPPDDRLAIKTYIRKFDEAIIREAILREIHRGGQVYFVYNKVQSIHAMAQLIRRIVPEIRLGIGHGQLQEKMLESVMKRFIDHEIDLLLCTSIIESGLDIPSANTIIINRADQFGLAQLYQLRGRVGRYRHQAYAYLMIPGGSGITPEARKRLAAIEELTELGSGFQLASRDLEIRGAGNMLGHKQSGHVNVIGFDLYCKLIEEAVKELKGEKIEEKIEPEINFLMKGFIPKDYIPDLNQRLEIYRRIYLTDDLDYMESLEAEMADRFGDFPDPVEKMLRLLEIRILCQKLHVTKAVLKNNEVLLNIAPSTPLSSEYVLGLLDKNLRLKSENELMIKVPKTNWRDDLSLAQKYLKALWTSTHVS